MKKKLLVIAVFILTLSNIYALDMSGLIGESNYFDSALIAMLLEFYTYRIMFINLAKLIAVSVAVIGAFWWVMKIILLGENVEKAIINIVTRLIVYVVLTMFYFNIVDGGLSLACQLGLGRSLSKMSEKLTQMTKQIEEQLNNAQSVLKNSIEFGYKYTGISEKEIKQLAKRSKMTTSDLEKYLADHDVQIYSGSGFWGIKKNKVSSYRQKVMDDYNAKADAYNQAIQRKNMSQTTGGRASVPLTSADEKAIEAWEKARDDAEAMKDRAIDSFTNAVMYDPTTNEKTKTQKTKTPGITFDDAVTRLDAIAKTFMSPAEAENLWSDANEAWKNLKPVNVSSIIKVNPFIDDGHGGFILSPSMILKVGIFVATLSNSQTASSINTINLSDTTTTVNSTGLGVTQQSDNSGSGGSVIQKAKTKLQNFTYKHIFSLIIDLIINIGIIACCIYFCIQYCMMLLEYYLVFAIGFLLLPFIVLEPLASYTKNLLKLLISYFFKGMVMCICLGFAWSQFLELSEILTRPGVGGTMVWTDPWTLLVTVYFTLTICLAFVGEAPKIAQTLLSGNPDMSMGEFMKQSAAVVMGAKRGGKLAKKAATTTAKATGKAVSTVASTAAGMAGAGAGKAAEVSKARDMQEKARGEHADALKTQSAAQKKETAAGAKLSGAQAGLNAANANASGAKNRLDTAKAGLATAKAKMGQAQTKKDKKAARKDFITAQQNVDSAQSEYNTAKQEQHKRQDEFNIAQNEYDAVNSELLTANSEVERTGGYLKATTAQVQRAKRSRGAMSYVGNAMVKGVSNGVSRMIGMDRKMNQEDRGMGAVMKFQKEKGTSYFNNTSLKPQTYDNETVLPEEN